MLLLLTLLQTWGLKIIENHWKSISYTWFSQRKKAQKSFVHGRFPWMSQLQTFIFRRFPMSHLGRGAAGEPPSALGRTAQGTLWGPDPIGEFHWKWRLAGKMHPLESFLGKDKLIHRAKKTPFCSLAETSMVASMLFLNMSLMWTVADPDVPLQCHHGPKARWVGKQTQLDAALRID